MVICARNSVWIECFPPIKERRKEEVGGSNPPGRVL